MASRGSKWVVGEAEEEVVAAAAASKSAEVESMLRDDMVVMKGDTCLCIEKEGMVRGKRGRS